MLRDRAAKYEKGNATCAKIILATPEQYGAGLVTWAERHLARHGQQQRATVASVGIVMQHGEQLEMFERTEAA